MNPDPTPQLPPVLPGHLPPFPSVPEGFSHWEYRGTEWFAHNVMFAILEDGVDRDWLIQYGSESYGNSFHYIEAIPIALANGIGVEPTSDPCESEDKPEAASQTPIMDDAMGWHDKRDLLHQIGVLEIELSQSNAAVGRLTEGLRRVLRYAERNTCLHEETHRGGAIWEVCDSCGKKWADDEGGKPENAHEWPEDIAFAQDVLLSSPPAPDGWREISGVPLNEDVLLYWPAKMGRTLRPAQVTVGQVHSLVHYCGATHFQPLPKPPIGKGGLL